MLVPTCASPHRRHHHHQLVSLRQFHSLHFSVSLLFFAPIYQLQAKVRSVVQAIGIPVEAFMACQDDYYRKVRWSDCLCSQRCRCVPAQLLFDMSSFLSILHVNDRRVFLMYIEMSLRRISLSTGCSNSTFTDCGAVAYCFSWPRAKLQSDHSLAQGAGS